jgi:hypothetical protein
MAFEESTLIAPAVRSDEAALGEPAHSHPHRKVLAFHVGRADVLRIGVALTLVVFLKLDPPSALLVSPALAPS